MHPSSLAGILEKLPRVITPDVLVDMETMDDAGVLRITPDMALVQTVDFFQPVVNDPKTFGRIVAANCLSDVWAMGGSAKTAMNILAYPVQKIPASAIEALILGACEKLQEAGVVLMGGHTMEHAEIIYGMSVTGTIHPDKIFSNSRARIGDALILTKPLGAGTYAEAFSKNGLSEKQYKEFVSSMERLNMYASSIFQEYDVSAMTDVTGFGLLGHALMIAKNAKVTLKFNSSSIPAFTDVFELMKKYRSPQTWKMSQYVYPYAYKEEGVSTPNYDLLVEPQTSGGLLAAVDPSKADEIVKKLRKNGDYAASKIGEVVALEVSNNKENLYLYISR